MKHLVDDTLLAAHALGQTREAVSLLVESHCALVEESRRRLEALEALGGVALEELEGSPLPSDALDRLMARLDEPAPPEPRAPRVPSFLTGLALPAPLSHFVEGARGWKTLLPGVLYKLELPLDWEGTPVALVRMRGGFRVPLHDHSGPELNLVLAGGFDDGDTEYVRGDVSVKGAGDEHGLRIHDDGDCVVLTVRRGPMVPLGPVSRLGSWLTGF